MKQLQAPRQRNQFVAAALFRKAGSHRKSNKALRQQEKQQARRRDVGYSLH
jgi:hypothetical protein